MKTPKSNLKILQPKNQTFLYGFNNYFNLFVKLFKKKRLPNTILLSGPKGSGKSTFIYHFANFLLSINENNKYSIKDYSINKNNRSYNLVNSNTHTNFFSLENNSSNKEIKVDQVRNLLNFLNKSTYSKDLKIVLIDSSENLNINSSNALLKAIEEPENNTFFFIIQNNSLKILETIKSRCAEFKIFHNFLEKKDIFNNIINQYKEGSINHDFIENLYFDSPGNLLKYSLILKKENSNVIKNDILNFINTLMELYKKEKNLETLNFINLFINKFYNELCYGTNNISKLLLNYTKIFNYIDQGDTIQFIIWKISEFRF